LVVELRDKYSNNEKTVPGYWSQFGPTPDVLIGKAAVVVFLLQAGSVDLAWLKENNDGTHRNALINYLGPRAGRTIPELQGMSDQKLVQLRVPMIVEAQLAQE
jgi:hypothetical protein